jgi:RNA polymerase sigma-70 factor (ECF subfamily)
MASLTGTLVHAPQIAWQFHSFDQDYLRRLASGDAAWNIISAPILETPLLKLRARIRSTQLIEDIRQETLLRVLRMVRMKGVEHPERFGAFVSGVCSNVMMELLRGEMRHEGFSSEFEPADDRVDLEALLVNQQRRRQVDRILEELPQKDRELLRMFFLEERDKNEICERLKVRKDYLRVLLHRAKSRFRSMHSKRFSPPPVSDSPTQTTECSRRMRSPHTDARSTYKSSVKLSMAH